MINQNKLRPHASINLIQQAPNPPPTNPTQPNQKQPLHFQINENQNIQRHHSQPSISALPPSQRTVCPSWLFATVGIIIVTIVSVSVYYYSVHRANKLQYQFQSAMRMIKVSYERECLPGYFMYQGKCITCPQNTFWNGAQCKQVPRLPNRLTSFIFPNMVLTYPVVDRGFRPDNLKEFIQKIKETPKQILQKKRQ